MDENLCIGCGVCTTRCKMDAITLHRKYNEVPVPNELLMMRYGIPSFKLEKEVVDAEIDVLRQLGVDIRCGVEIGRDITIRPVSRLI